MVSRGQLVEDLRRFVAHDLLGDERSLGEIDDRTPLLEWGILDSLSTSRLVSHLRNRFGIDIPPELIVLDHFRDIGAIAALALRMQGEGAAAPAVGPAPAPARA